MDQNAISNDGLEIPDWPRRVDPKLKKPCLVLGSLPLEDTATIESLARKILHSEVAKLTFYKVLDGNKEMRARPRRPTGLPLEYDYKITDTFRAEIQNLHSLEIPVETLVRFQGVSSNAPAGSPEKALKLFELLVEVIHALAVRLYVRDMGMFELLKSHGINPDEWLPFLVHDEYRELNKFPFKDRDMAAFWAETEIFGGVIRFDRGTSGDDCLGAFVHPQRARPDPSTWGPPLLYPLPFESIKIFFALWSKMPLPTSRGRC